jgi:hypothetical protein
LQDARTANREIGRQRVTDRSGQQNGADCFAVGY